MLSHIVLSTDVVILATFAFVALVGLVMGPERMRGFVLSVYVGLVLAYELGGLLTDFLSHHSASLTPGRARLVLLAVPVLILTVTHHPHGRAKRHGFVLPLVEAILLAALIIASVLHLMDADMAAPILGSSQLAWPLLNLRLVWLAALPLATMAAVLAKSKKH